MKNTLILRRVLTAGIFLSLLTPFIVASDLYFPYITGKAYFFRVLVEVLFAGWLVLIISDPSARPKKSCVLWSLISFLVIVLIANLQGLDPSSSFWSNYERMEGFVTLIHLFGYFLVVSSIFNTKKIWDTFLNAFVATTIGQSFWAVLQGTGALGEKFTSNRAEGTFGNATYLAAFMMFGVFITLYLWMKNDSQDWKKYFYISALVLQIVSIFLTATRGTLIGIIVGVFVSVLVYAILEPTKKHLRKVLGGTAVAIVLFITLVFGFKESSIVQNTVALQRLSEISFSSGTVLSRFINWNIAWTAVKEKPLLGYGQGNYGVIFDKNYDVRMWNQEKFFDRVHNLFLDWLVAAGFLGLLSYLSVLGCAIYYIWKKESEFSNVVKASFSGLFVAYFIHVMFVFDSLTSYIPLFFVFAFIHSTVAKPINLFEKINLSKNITPILALAILVGTPFFVFGMNGPSYLQNKGTINSMRYATTGKIKDSLDSFTETLQRRTFGQQESLLQLMAFSAQVVSAESVPQEIKQSFANLTVSEIKLYLEKNPDDSRVFFVAGQFYAQIGDFDSSLEMLNSAVKISPDKQFLYQPIVGILFQQGKVEESVALAKEVYEKNTDNDEFWNTYVQYVLRSENIISYNNLIEESFSQKKGYRVVNLLKNNLENNSENAQVYASLAVAYYRTGDSENAIKTLELLSEKFPKIKNQTDDLIERIKAGEEII